MKYFFQHSYWFWVVSKFLFAILIFFSTITILGEGRLKQDEFLTNIAGLIESVLLAITLIHDCSKTVRFKVLKVISGILMIGFGVAMFVLLLTVSESGRSAFYFLGFPLALWMILIGLFDLVRPERLLDANT